MKRILSIVLGFMLLGTNVCVAEQAVAFIDKANLPMGYITIKYDGLSSAKHKAILEKDGFQYTYTLDKAKPAESFPLQMGNGSYKLTVYENVKGNSYRPVNSESFTAPISDSARPYLQSVQSIEWNDSTKAVIKARELTKNLNTDAEKVEVIHNYVVKNIKYDEGKINSIGANYLPNIDEIYSAGSGICYDFSSIMAGMLRSVGIPTKLIKGYSNTTTVYHSWNEIYLNGKWIIVDASYDSQMSERKQSYAMAKDVSWYDKKYEY